MASKYIGVYKLLKLWGNDETDYLKHIADAFLIARNQMGYAEVAYRGIEKNMN